MKKTLYTLAWFLAFFAKLYGLPQPQSGSRLGFISLATFTNLGPRAVNGSSPYGLLLGKDGALYGTLQTGAGATAQGAVFKMGLNGNIAWTLPMTNAAHPTTLFQGTDGSLYGLGSGMVFSATTNGSLRWTAAPTNSGDVSWLTLGADGDLYGACATGGTSSNGQMVSIDTTGSYRWVYSFNGSNGQTPSGPLTQGIDGKLYGVTTNGGINGQGTVFSVGTNGSANWTYSFNGQRRRAFGQLLQTADGQLIGSTYDRGSLNSQSVFSIGTNGVTNWFYSPPLTNKPNGTLLQEADGNLIIGDSLGLFSLTTNGTFRWTTGLGNSATPLVARRNGDFLASVTGLTIYSVTAAGLVDGSTTITNASDGTLFKDAVDNLFGAAGPYPSNPGGGRGGQVFELAAAPVIATPARDVMDLNASAASFAPSAIGAPSLSYQWQKDGTNIVDGPHLVGTTSNQLTISPVSSADAGYYSVIVSNYYGTIMSAQAALTLTNSFTVANGNWTLTLPNPSLFGSGNLILPYLLIAGHDGYFYGTALNGSVFKLTTNAALVWSTGSSLGFSASSLIKGIDGFLHASDGAGLLTYTTNGAFIKGSRVGGALFTGVVQDSAQNFYWTKVNPGVPGIYATTSNGVAIWSYTNTTAPSDVIVGRDGNIYACSVTGGTNSQGSVFALTPSGVPLWTYSFAGTDGLYPDGLSQGADGFLYGTAFGDFSNSFGNVFKMSTNGTLSWSFAFGLTNGASIGPNLLQASDGNLYGAARAGGAFGAGEIFQMTTNGALTVIYPFSGGADGGGPESGPLQTSDGSYGVATTGGIYSAGVFYQLDLGLPPPTTVVTAPTLQAMPLSSGSFTLSWDAVPGAGYQLQFKDELGSETWSNLGAVIEASNILSILTNNADASQRFYRLLVVP